MILSNTIKVTKEYSGSSKFNFWNNIQVDDTLTVSVNLEHISRSNHGLHSITVTISNDRDGTKFSSGWNDICNYLKKLELQQFSLPF